MENKTKGCEISSAKEPSWRQLWRIKDFCPEHGISRSTVYKLIAAGKLRTVTIAGRRLIPGDEAQRLYREGCK